MNYPPRVLNLYAGPGTGKSTMAAAVFAELKFRGINCEYVQEYAKDATWENRGPKLFAAQQYIFGKQSFRLSRVASEVDITITDSPLLQSLAYVNFPQGSIPALLPLIQEVYHEYDNLDIYLRRSDDRPYNPKGRNQTVAEAKDLDGRVLGIVSQYTEVFYPVVFRRAAVQEIIGLMVLRGWLDPETVKPL